VTFLDKNELRARQTETNASIISIFLIYTRTKTDVQPRRRPSFVFFLACQDTFLVNIFYDKYILLT